MALKRNLISFIIIIFLSMTLLLSITLFFMSLAKNSRIKAEIASKCDGIKKIAEKSKMPISKESLLFLGDEQNKLKNAYSRFKLALGSSLSEEVAEEESDPLQFKERLIQTQKKLRKDADEHNLLLPESLGFAKYETKLSEPFEIPDLIRRLKVIEELIYIMTLTGIDSLDEIHFAEKGAKKKALPLLDIAVKGKKDIYFDIPVSFKIGCTSSKLIDLLYKLRLSQFIFIVDDLDMERAQAGYDKEVAVEERLKTSLSIRAIVLK